MAKLAHGIHSQTTPIRWSTLFPPGSPHAAVAAEAAACGAVMFERQSTQRQVEENEGSQFAQRDYAAFVIEEFARRGVPRSRWYFISGLGESGSRDADREAFNEVQALVERDAVGLVVFPEHHRIGRNIVDAEYLFDACAARGVRVLVGPTVYDPADHNDRRVLQGLASDAEHHVKSQTVWSSQGRLAKSRRLAFALKLPTGLVWVNPRDETYLKRAQAANLWRFLKAWPSQHKTQVVNKLRIALYVMPFPDAEVIASIELRFRWLLETRSMEAVARRIYDGADGYPHRGKVPEYRSPLWTSDLRPVWRSIRDVNLRAWFLHPVWGGTYSVYTEALAHESVRTRHHTKKSKGVHFARAVAANQPALPGFDVLLAAGSSGPLLYVPDNATTIAASAFENTQSTESSQDA